MDIKSLMSSFQDTISNALNAAIPTEIKQEEELAADKRESKIYEKDSMNEIGLAIKRR